MTALTEAEVGGAGAELRRPRIKPEHRAYRTVDGNVRIGSVIYGIGAEITDPDGWIWTLTQLMDGTRSGPRIAADVAGAHPAVDAETVGAAIDELRQAGFVEDAAAPLPPGLAERDRLRHTRGVALLRWMDLSPRASPWQAQLRLRQARALVLGVGGTGGAAAQILTAAGVGRLHVVDPDTVELSNLNRQLLYGEADIGHPKADAAVAALRALNSDVAVTGERREIRGQDALAELVAEGPAYDVLVLGADRPPEIRRWANRVCLAAGLPWVEGGYRGPLVTAGVHVPGSGPCWECQREGESARRDLRLAPGQDEAAASPRMPWNPASAVTATLSGTLVAHAALAILTGVPPMRPGFRYGINLMSLGDPVLQIHPRRPTCPACGLPPGVPSQ
ncbi:HesA/MoeB/ThiF family protein [Actinacidiphila bryophytorum]|uniref:HesA/MoeB/ThiF family protein n=1 Tax=Actinacidiphila bryophytorum TaxID=1436133 RepID=UPI002176D2A0|nr:ThiF family adenylyltransferase [Actinacidiphila bryophytorum]UWE13090.1 ThiF family adenylyltransferase [Actinacidiphila bryophytorum]